MTSVLTQFGSRAHPLSTKDTKSPIKFISSDTSLFSQRVNWDLCPSYREFANNLCRQMMEWVDR